MAYVILYTSMSELEWPDYLDTTTLEFRYYVNPKVLLIAPKTQNVLYGTTGHTLDYDIQGTYFFEIKDPEGNIIEICGDKCEFNIIE